MHKKVDAHVGSTIFEKCIKNLLHDKTVILCTHQLQYLKQVDEIIVIENMEIAETGTYQQLLDENTSSKLSKLLENIDMREKKQENGKEGITISTVCSPSDENQKMKNKEERMDKRKEKIAKENEQQEERVKGTISPAILLYYGQTTGSLLNIVIAFLLYVVSQIFILSPGFFIFLIQFSTKRTLTEVLFF